MKHTQSLYPILILLLLAAGATSCGKRTCRDTLLRAETLMETDPYAARDLLDSLERTEKENLQSSTFNKQSKRDAALYAILRTQTDYKCYVPLTSDSLIRTAVKYYGTPHRKDYHAAMAWYSLGCVASERKEDIKAIDAYLHALELFPDPSVRYYMLAEQNVGIHYLNRQMLDDALATFRTCAVHLQAADKPKDLAYIGYYTALTHLYRNEFAEARKGFTETWENPYTSNYLKGESLLQLAKIALFDDKDYTKALDYIDRHITFTEYRYLGVDYSLMGDAYQAMEEYDSAYQCYRLSLDYDNEVHTLCCDYKELTDLAPLTGHTDSLATYVAQYTLLLDSIGELRRTEEITSLQNNHTLELERRQMSYQRHWTWALTLFIILIVSLLLTLWFVQRDRQRKSDYITLMDELRQRHLTKYENLQDTLDSCCTLFRQTTAFEIMTEAERKHSKQIDKKAPNLIAHDINTCFAPFKKVVKNEAPKLNDKEFMFVVCHYLGFDIQTISLFFSTAYSTLTSMKSRLKRKMPAELYAVLFP